MEGEKRNKMSFINCITSRTVLNTIQADTVYSWRQRDERYFITFSITASSIRQNRGVHCMLLELRGVMPNVGGGNG